MLKLRVNNDFADDDRRNDTGIRLSGRILFSNWVFYPLLAVASLWVFCYVSGLFPYLGYKAGGYRTWDGPVGRTSYGIGDNDAVQIHYIFLFSGQTAIVDYDVAVRKGALEIELQEGVNPFAPSLMEHKVSASGKGRASVKVPSTGVYTLYFRPTYASPATATQTDINYTLWWGATF